MVFLSSFTAKLGESWQHSRPESFHNDTTVRTLSMTRDLKKKTSVRSPVVELRI